MALEELVPRGPTDTTPPWDGIGRVRRARTARRALLALFALVLALGATGLLGVRKAHVRASGGGYDLLVEYPRITRPGHAVPLLVEVRRAGGFGDQPITVSMRSGYFRLFDENGVMPAPSKETATSRDLVWDFDPPQGEVLRIYFDTRTGPNRQRGARGDAAVLVDDTRVVSVSFRTWVAP